MVCVKLVMKTESFDSSYEHFEKATIEELEKFLEMYGNEDNLEDNQNESPTVFEMKKYAEAYKHVRYGGYIVKKPREDYRVSVDTLELQVSYRDAIPLLAELGRSADDVDYKFIQKNLVWIRFWWD